MTAGEALAGRRRHRIRGRSRQGGTRPPECGRPQLLCLDEPAAGLNPAETAALGAIVRTLRDRHAVSVLLIEHDMGMVMGISDHIVVLDQGEVIAAGAPAAVRHDPKVIAAYLGADEEELA